MKKLLIIEDDDKLCQNLTIGLKESGYVVTSANSGEEGLSLIMESIPDAILLDLNLPKRDGLEILQTLRKHYSTLPIIIISARDTVDERVLGLNLGADDYLVKPFAFSELLARLQALFRREQQNVYQHKAADLEMDVVQRKFYRSGQHIELTAREFDIMELLLRNKGQVVSRQTIAHDVWKQVQRATPLDNVIDVHIMRLRKKIDSADEDSYIQTVRGIGFCLKSE